MSDMNIGMVVKMAGPKRAARELEVAFREAGILGAHARHDAVVVDVDGVHIIEVKAISAGHGRPVEVRNALAHLQVAAPNLTATIVADHFTTGAVQLLNEAGANYLDDSYFVFHAREPFVAINQVRVARRTAAPNRELSLAGRTGIAVQEILLDQRECWRVTELAAAAEVAVGTAQRALQRLEDLNLLTAEGAGPKKCRRVADRGALLERWTIDARKERKRIAALYVHGQGPTGVAGAVSSRLERGLIRHAVTGATAALYLAPHATEVRICEVWVDVAAGVNLIAQALEADPVDRGGNVVVLQAKTDAPLFDTEVRDGVRIANPLRVYADLLEDPRRGEEQAQFLRETVLGF